MNSPVSATADGKARIVLGEVFHDSDCITGWCWSPDSPKERLRISVVVDGRIVGSTVAARLRTDLVRDGVCDGYHGFSLPLAQPLTHFSRLEACEWNMGQVFGRILADQMSDAAGWQSCVDAWAGEVAGLHAGLASPPPFSRVSDAFRVAGGWLRDKAPVAAAASLPAGLRLPEIGQPAISLILQAGARMQDAAAAALVLLAPMLRFYSAEIVLSDSGRGRLSTVLSALPGLRYCLVPTEGDVIHSDAAARMARAPMLGFIRPGDVRGGTVAALFDMFAGSSIVIGGPAAALAVHSGIAEGFETSPSGAAFPGLSLMTPRDVFRQLGGLDHGLDDGAELHVLDFALRARQVGHDVAVMREPWDNAPACGARAAEVRRRFVARWRSR